MKKMKVLAMGLVLSLAGAVYAVSNVQESQANSCAMSKDGASCCKAGAACCKDGNGSCCKMKRMA